MSRYKRTRILEYKGSFAWIRKIYKFISRIFKYPDLPKKGESLKEIYITDIVIKDRNPEVLESLLLRIYNEYRDKRYNMMIIGSFQG